METIAGDIFASRNVIVDVTNVSTQPFVTGIQRVVRSTALANSDRIRLVRFDKTASEFRFVDEIPRIVPRSKTTLGWILALLFGPLVRAGLIYVTSQKSRRLRIHPELIRFGKWLRNRFAHDAYLEDDGAWLNGPVWKPSNADLLLILEVASEKRHIEALKLLVSRKKGRDRPRTVVFLYDLIPVRQAPHYDPRPPEYSDGSFRNYLEIVKRADKLVFLSEWARREYLDYLRDSGGVSVGRIGSFVYPPGPPIQKAPPPTASAYPDLRILGIGALDRRKNFLVILRALEILIEKGTSAEFRVVAGRNTPRDPRINQFLKKNRQVFKARFRVFSGVSDVELEGLYRWSNVVVVPSVAEGFGLPVLEAVSHNRNVVSSGSTAMLELSKHLPMLLAGPHNPAEWAIAMEAATKNPPPELLELPELEQFSRDWRNFLDLILTDNSPA